MSDGFNKREACFKMWCLLFYSYRLALSLGTNVCVCVCDPTGAVRATLACGRCSGFQAGGNMAVLEADVIGEQS